MEITFSMGLLCMLIIILCSIFIAKQIESILKTRVSNHIDKLCSDKVKQTYQKIEVKSGYPFNNNKCHENSLWFYNKNNGLPVLVYAIYKNSNTLFVHFINKDKVGYIDNTLGAASDLYDYYYVKDIHNPTISSIQNLLVSKKKTKSLIGGGLYNSLLIRFSNHYL